MPTEVLGYAATSSTSDLAPHRFDRRDPRPDDGTIEILYCGVCHSDLHTARNDWGWTAYPRTLNTLRCLDEVAPAPRQANPTAHPTPSQPGA